MFEITETGSNPIAVGISDAIAPNCFFPTLRPDTSTFTIRFRMSRKVQQLFSCGKNEARFDLGVPLWLSLNQNRVINLIVACLGDGQTSGQAAVWTVTLIR